MAAIFLDVLNNLLTIQSDSAQDNLHVLDSKYLSETMEAKRNWHNSFQVLKKKNC